MSAVLDGLDAEWRRLARSPRARRALIRWRVTQPVFTVVDDFGDLLERRREDPDVAQELLLALAALAPDDELAARVLLQAVVPAVVRLSLTAGHGDRDALDVMLALAWERIRTYPATRHGSVAGNIKLDVLKRYQQHREIDRPLRRHQRDAAGGDPGGLDSDESLAERRLATAAAEEVALDRLGLDGLVGVLADCRRQGVVSEPALRLIVQTRIAGEPITELAARSGVNRNTLTAQRFRAERRIRDFRLAG